MQGRWLLCWWRFHRRHRRWRLRQGRIGWLRRMPFRTGKRRRHDRSPDLPSLHLRRVHWRWCQPLVQRRPRRQRYVFITFFHTKRQNVCNVHWIISDHCFVIFDGSAVTNLNECGYEAAVTTACSALTGYNFTFMSTNEIVYVFYNIII